VSAPTLAGSNRLLASATTAELVQTLAHPNGWHRDTAARLLFERRDKSAIPLLQQLAHESKLPLARMHALYALAGLDALSAADLDRALDDMSPIVRRHAIRLSDSFAGSAVLQKKLRTLGGDPDQRVRYELAFHEANDPERIPVLRSIIERDAEDPWIRAAVLNSLAAGAGDLFVALNSDTSFAGRQGASEFTRELVTIIGAANRSNGIARALPIIAASSTALDLARALGSGLQARWSFPRRLRIATRFSNPCLSARPHLLPTKPS
jgi:HEAT repeat protein